MKSAEDNFPVIFATGIALMVMISFFPGCDKNETPAPQPGKINFRFTHYNQGEPQQFDTMKYVNAAGNEYLVNEIQYFISDVRLQFSDGSIQLLDGWKDIHYVDSDLPATHIWPVFDELKAGDVEKVIFTFGITAEKNHSLMFVNPPERDMFWPEVLGGGYHYLKLNGKWRTPDSQVFPFDFHLGIGQIYSGGVVHVDSITGFVQNHFDVELPGSSFTISEGDLIDAEIRMHVENWFQSPNIYNHDTWGGDIMQTQAAMQMGCENGQHDVFTFHKK